MRLKRVSLTAAISLVAGLTTATVDFTGSVALADSTAALPLSHYSHLLVDAAYQHLFFSQGPGSTGILVTDLDGTPVTTLADEPGATGLALSADGGTLYAALADGDAVAAVDTATLTESARWSTGTASAPASVAVAGGRVWYGYTVEGQGAIGSVDPSAADPAATPQPSMSHWITAPELATGGGVLAAEEPRQNSSHVATFDVSSGTASPTQLPSATVDPATTRQAPHVHGDPGTRAGLPPDLGETADPAARRCARRPPCRAAARRRGGRPAGHTGAPAP